MDDRRGGTIPHIYEQDPPPELPEYPYAGQPRARNLQEWIADLTTNQQLGYGCIAVVVISVALLYCVGAATFLVRPLLVERAAVTPTPVVRPTLVPTPTQLPQPTSFIQLPPGTLIATPTQAPIPSRDSFIPTATPELMSGMTATPGTPPLRSSVTPSRRAGPSPTATAR